MKSVPHAFAVLVCASGFVAPAAAAPLPHVLLECEGFRDTGGWAIDPQFMDNMGSPYLLAHGLGTPVADAATTAAIPAAGDYRVWVRTMDWVERWQAPGDPGRFEIVINGKTLPKVFGAEGAEWHWQDGGVVSLPAGATRVALHDLMGFEGRCDAILLTRDVDFRPPNADPRMADFRRRCLGLPKQPETVETKYDLVVTGGGIAGTCAALSAARNGLKVALIQDRPVLGGNNSSEVRVWLQGARNKMPWPRIGDVVAELEQDRRAHFGADNTADLYEDDKKLAVVRAEPNIDLYLEHRVNGAEATDGAIRAVVAQQTRTGRRLRITGSWFADCTGDGCVGFLAGADWDLKKTGHMGPCNLWNVCECKDENAINTNSAVEAEAVPFPRCPWALDLSDKPFPGRSKIKPDPKKLGGWYWESGFDRDPIEEMEYIRDWNFRAMYGAWDALKNVDKVLPNHRLNWSAYILGKRESRRLMGDVVLTADDLKNDRHFADACVPTGWSNDLHYADDRFDKGFEGDAFISYADHGTFPAHKQKRPFWIPYRCLYSRNLNNLFMAGRCISVTHESLGAVRVMRTCGCQGEVVGMAASLCKSHGTTPRGVYEDHLRDLHVLMSKGAGKRRASDSIGPGAAEPPRVATPRWLKQAGENLARAATVELGDDESGPVKTHLLLNDGNGKLEDNSGRWVYRRPLPHSVVFRWERAVEIGAARIVSGFYKAGRVTTPIEAFTLEYRDGDAWRTLGPPVSQNRSIDWGGTFPGIRTDAVRLSVAKTQNNISRIWEVEFYEPVDL